jgi:hypothetical protein
VSPDYNRDEMELHSLDHAAEPTLGIQQHGPVMIATHPERICAGRETPCVIHSPSEHHMRTWKLNYRGDTGVMERLCPHGVGHPDPDALAFAATKGETWLAVHGCDGCCRPPAATPERLHADG